MAPRLQLLLPLLLSACVPEAEVKNTPSHVPDTDTAEGTDTPEGLSTAVVSTISEDYAVGALATVGLSDWHITDEIVDLTGDTVLRTSGDRVFALHRFTYDTVRIYQPGDWSAPEVEVALADGANPHDVEMCGGLAFITQYGRDDIAVIDPDTGILVGAVDLSSLADSDGIPEVSTMVQGAPGTLYVGAHNFDRNADWVSAGGGVAEIDCESQAVTHTWSFETADVYIDPEDTDHLYVYATGDGLYRLDTTTREPAFLVSEDDLGAAVVGLAASAGQAVVTTTDDAYAYGVGCIALDTGAFDPIEAVDNYLISIDANSAGEAWVSARSHWSNPAAPNGLLVYDIPTCSARTTTGPLSTVLAPFSVAFY